MSVLPLFVLKITLNSKTTEVLLDVLCFGASSWLLLVLYSEKIKKSKMLVFMIRCYASDTISRVVYSLVPLCCHYILNPLVI